MPTRLQAWVLLHKFPKWLTTLLPFLLGSVLAYGYTGMFDWWRFLASFLALAALTGGSLVANEVYDLESDRMNAGRIGGENQVNVNTTGGSKVLVRGLLTPTDALRASLAWFVLAVVLGLWLQFGLETGPLTIPLGVAGFYSAPPVKAVYRGLGELFIALGLTMIVYGGFYVQAGNALFPLLMALPLTIAAPAAKIVREFPDYEADELTDKRTLTVMLGRERMSKVYAGMMFLAVLAFVPAVLYVRSFSIIFVLAPVFLLLRSSARMLTDEWRQRGPMVASVKDGFVGMLLVPVALMLVFLVDAVW
jgi:1,4-dihydroxy-2-naphthoate octaprenyltransferase